jgi:steroid delta-isomerase-like uncharacterized protein
MTHRQAQRLETLTSSWDRAWNGGESDALDAILDPKYVRHTASTRGDARLGALHAESRDDYKCSIAKVRTAFPDLRTEIVDMIVDGDKVAIRWSTTGTHEGTFGGSPATGKRVTVAGVTISRFRDDRIVEDWVTFDPVDLLLQLGIVRLGI